MRKEVCTRGSGNWTTRNKYFMVLLILQSPYLEGITLQKEYDFIIIGGGAAGCLLAARLTDNPKFDVLLLEAGGEETILQSVPLTSPMLFLTPAAWQYMSERNETFATGMKDGRIFWPQGRGLGGLNDGVYTRGDLEDYNNWERLGNTNWGYQKVLSYFHKFENINIPEISNHSSYNSKKGSMPITYLPFRTPLAEAFIQSGLLLNNRTENNGTSFSYVQSTQENGEKYSGYRAFIKPIRNRNNLHIFTGTTVTKILIDDAKRAYGVQFKFFGILNIEIHARKEIIVCAGTINSAQLLMLSGIGPKEHLQSFAIPLIQDSKVGYNLQDHVTFLNLFFTVNKTVDIDLRNLLSISSNFIKYLLTREGEFTTLSGFEALSFMKIGEADPMPNAELYFGGLLLPAIPFYLSALGTLGEELGQFYQPIKSKHGFTILPMLSRPYSVGRVKLRDGNPFSKPLIYPNFFSDQRDMEILIEATKRAIEIVKAEPFQKYNAQLYPEPIPQCKQIEFASDSYWECCIRVITMTTLHSTGTCKMGPDEEPDAVVDPSLRVRGISNLRVVGAAIMPVITSAHTISPVYVIAEKAADMIKDDWIPVSADINQI